MSAPTNPYDNAQAESFMNTREVEQFYIASYETFRDVATQPRRFIEEIYNTKRLHSALGYVPPSEFEENFAQHATWFWRTQRSRSRGSLQRWVTFKLASTYNLGEC